METTNLLKDTAGTPTINCPKKSFAWVYQVTKHWLLLNLQPTRVIKNMNVCWIKVIRKLMTSFTLFGKWRQPMRSTIYTCNSQWLACALEILQKNGIYRVLFVDAIVALLVLGWGKGHDTHTHKYRTSQSPNRYARFSQWMLFSAYKYPSNDPIGLLPRTKQRVNSKIALYLSYQLSNIIFVQFCTTENIGTTR